ncbi:arsenate reductase (glutaredoxin) [Paenirhodobacter sp.]|uniref:arsenate reductase (glutaredoxin) n=1 Tax=Paenirhodobacter sp. TaxID=1965326 RepID=UPI003B40F0F0
MAVTVTIWHNPRCTKSRETLALLRERGVEPMVRLYLEDPPTRAELVEVLAKLGLPASALVRWKEESAPERGASEDAILDALTATPRVIERPVVIVGERARIGRPPEAVLDLL